MVDVISPRGMVSVPSTSNKAMVRGFSGVDIVFCFLCSGSGVIYECLLVIFVIGDKDSFSSLAVVCSSSEVDG